MARKIAAGNWKMNGSCAALEAFGSGMTASLLADGPDVVLCPPAPLLVPAQQLLGASGIALGGQDCHAGAQGAHTGDCSAEMLAEAGAGCVIVGHSERRADHGETDADVRAKAEAAYRAGLTAIICLGESEAARTSGTTLEVIAAQLSGSLPETATAANTVIAYEPIWAIGTGRVPEMADIAEVHSALRAQLSGMLGAATADNIPLLYGGSVKGSNAAEIFAVPDVDGALVGGASLKAEDFAPIVSALAAS